MVIKPIKKKKSLSAQLKSLRNDRDAWRNMYNNVSDSINKLRQRLYELEKSLPLKYYIVDFEIKSKIDCMCKKKESVKAYTIHHAIKLIKQNKIHPDTFNLLDVKVIE